MTAIFTMNDLEKKENPTFEEFKMYLNDCLKTGAALPDNSEAVLVLNKIELTREEKREVLSMCCVGAIDQLERGFPSCARRYRELMEALGRHPIKER